jgi:two-component system KDP operon response regulator KdpE
MSGERVLVVDDEQGIRDSLRAFLTEQGYAASTASSGEQALNTFETLQPDVVLLDLLMPDMSGMEVCRQIRTQWQTPIIVLSVMGNESDKVEALEAGADDYLIKPFGLRELHARIRVALRHQHAQGADQRVFHHDDLTVEFDKQLVTLRGEEVRLTPTEYAIVRCLVANAGRVVTHATLLKDVWGAEQEANIASLRFAMVQVRRKLGDDPLRPRFIATVPAVGYRFRTTA